MFPLQWRRRLQRWWSKAPWLTLLALLALLHVLGYAMMLWQEPHGSQLRSLLTYTYFFVVTVTTAGRLTAAVIGGGGACQAGRWAALAMRVAV